ncbi:hypothetical protein C4226_04180 [Clostridioides difficile]|nr:hypothetical protein [Clostridioides difficile]MDB0503257.1 hypothetical protein [Clostridioides difficile]MDB3405422.1 hypothetical protein [Clostridioides difficile]MDB3513430.1 hypothetical protein [Clostridioides difficile]
MNFTDLFSFTKLTTQDIIYDIITLLGWFVAIGTFYAAKRTITQSKEQYIEDKRASVVVSFESISFGRYAFVFRNLGSKYATDIKVKINEEFIKQAKGQTYDSLIQLSKSSFVLSQYNQFNLVLLERDFKESMFSLIADFYIEYNNGYNKITEDTHIDLSQYKWACEFEDPIVHNMKELIKVKKSMNTEIKSISKNFDSLMVKYYSSNENISCSAKLFLIDIKNKWSYEKLLEEKEIKLYAKELTYDTDIFSILNVLKELKLNKIVFKYGEDIDSGIFIKFSSYGIRYIRDNIYAS